MMEEELGRERSFSTYMTVVRKILYVSRDRAVRSQKIFAATSRIFASSAASGILTGNDSFLIGKKWPGERNGKQKAKETLQASTDMLNSLKS